MQRPLPPDPGTRRELERRLVRRYTREKRSHRDLLEHERTFQSLMETMNVAFHYSEFVLDSGGEPCDLRYAEVNSRFLEILGKTRGEVVGKLHTQVHPGLDPFWFDVHLEVMRRNTPLRFERLAPTLGGHFEIYAFSPGPMKTAIFFSDINQRVRSAQAIQDLNQDLAARALELEEAVRELDSFSDSVSHDLRAPIRHVGGFAHLLGQMESANLSDKGKHYLDTIQRSVQNMGDRNRSGPPAGGPNGYRSPPIPGTQGFHTIA